MKKTPKRIRVNIINPNTLKITPHWDITYENGKVNAKALVDEPFYPTVLDDKGNRLSPDDGELFMQSFKSPVSTTVEVLIDY